MHMRCHEAAAWLPASSAQATLRLSHWACWAGTSQAVAACRPQVTQPAVPGSSRSRLVVQPPGSQEPVSCMQHTGAGWPAIRYQLSTSFRFTLPLASHRMVLLNSADGKAGWGPLQQGASVQGCMKSGQVLVDRRFKWFEPEYWRFGEAAASDGAINYPRHASGQIYGLSGPVAKYIRRNAPILHRYACSRHACYGRHAIPEPPHTKPACERNWGLGECQQVCTGA